MFKKEYTTSEISNIRKEAQLEVLADLVFADCKLLMNPTIDRMFGKIASRRPCLDCVFCTELPAEAWAPLYEFGWYVGWHCEEHRD